MEWFYVKEGKQEGPVDLETLRGMLESGQVAPTDLVWREGMAEWGPAENLPELHLAPSPAPAAGGGPAMGEAGGGSAPAAASQPGPVPAGQPLASPGSSHQVPNYLVPAILATIFCCQPFGIVAIVFAAQVDGKASSGDLAGALDSSNKAKVWTWVAFGCGVAIWVFVLLFWVLAVVGGAAGM